MIKSEFWMSPGLLSIRARRLTVDVMRCGEAPLLSSAGANTLAKDIIRSIPTISRVSKKTRKRYFRIGLETLRSLYSRRPLLFVESSAAK